MELIFGIAFVASLNATCAASSQLFSDCAKISKTLMVDIPVLLFPEKEKLNVNVTSEFDLMLLKT